MDIFVWIVFGGLAGWIASKLMNMSARQGAIANIVIGIIGAVIGGFVFNTLGREDITGFNFYSLGVAIIGSVILLIILKLVRR